MKINKEIEAKAKDIILEIHKEKQKKMDEDDYMTLCIEAGICPVCGDEIKEEHMQKGIYVDYIYKMDRLRYLLVKVLILSFRILL